MMISMSKKLPVYKEIRFNLLQDILANKYTTSQLPTEAELCKQYKVSRMTVNKALSMLVHEGLIRRIPGKGSFTNLTEIKKKFADARSFSQDVNTIGGNPGSKLLSFKKLTAKDHPEIAALFNLKDEDYFFLFERLRSADEVPLALTKTYISGKVIPDLREEVLEQSLYAYIREELGILPRCSDYQIRAREASQREQNLLGTETNALLVVKHISYTEDNIPFEYNESAYLGSKFFYVSSSMNHPHIETMDAE